MQLAARQPDGSSLRQHLQAAANAGARPDPRLSSTVPEWGQALWNAFIALDASRPAGLSRGAIPPSELLAWQQLMGVTLTPWESETLLAMDRAAMAAAAEQMGH